MLPLPAPKTTPPGSFVPAGTDVAGPRHAAEREAAACRRAVLRRFIIVAVLLAAHPQIASDIRNDFIATHLRTIQAGVTTALVSVEGKIPAQEPGSLLLLFS